MAGNHPPHGEPSSLGPQSAISSTTGDARWHKQFNGPTKPGRKDTVASRVIETVDSIQKLTQREKEVLVHFVEHLDEKRVARALGTCAQTVRNQIASIMDKLDLDSRLELVATIVVQSLQDS